MFSNDKIFNKIAEALLVDYSSVYYVNAVTNEYQWYSVDPEFHSLHIEQGGNDFFKNIIRDADKVVYEEDKHIFTEGFQKEKLLAEIEEISNSKITAVEVYSIAELPDNIMRILQCEAKNEETYIVSVSKDNTVMKVVHMQGNVMVYDYSEKN